MKTLIELFDESPILNVLASVAFKPEKLIFFGADPLQVEESRRDYERFFKSRGENPEIEYISTDMENIDEVNGTLAKIIAENPDCVVDVTGGKDIALLAAGMAAVRLGVPLIAYNKRTKRYANISEYEPAMRANIFGLLDCEDFSMSAADALRKARISANTKTISVLSGQRFSTSGTSILKTSAHGCRTFSSCRMSAPPASLTAPYR